MNTKQILQIIRDNQGLFAKKALQVNGIEYSNIDDFMIAIPKNAYMVLTKNDFEVCLPLEHSIKITIQYPFSFDTVKVFTRVKRSHEYHTPSPEAIKEFGTNA